MNVANSTKLVISFFIASIAAAHATTYWVNINSPAQVPPYTNNWNQAAHSVQQVLHWDSVPGRAYQVYWADSLTNAFQKIRPAVDYPVDTYTVETTNAAAFYQINVTVD